MKLFKRLLTIALLILVTGYFCTPVGVYAATDPSRSYDFDLTANGGKTITVELGGVIDFQLELKRTDADKEGHYAMYSMQDELIFDSRYFALVE